MIGLGGGVPMPEKSATPAPGAATAFPMNAEQKSQLQQPQAVQPPIVHCLVCQCRLELHRSLLSGPAEDATDCASSSIKSCALRSDDAKTDSAATFEHRLDLTSAVGTSQSANLLDLVADSSTPLDVPMCKKCANTVTAELNKQLGHLEKECIQYKKSLDHLLQRRADCPFDKEASRIKLDALKSEERDLLEQLTLLEGEERTLMHELEAKQAERRQIGQQDEELYRRLRDNHRTLIEQADEQRSLKLQIKQSNEQIRRLSRMNVLDMVFHIWVDGEYGTISGFRLGRLRHDQVEWSEINAALGQMTFLLKVIAERLDFEFVSYELVPCGSTSAIRILPKNGTTTAPISTAEELPLYGSGGWRPFGQQALDKALVAFMDCVCQLPSRNSSNNNNKRRHLRWRAERQQQHLLLVLLQLLVVLLLLHHQLKRVLAVQAKCSGNEFYSQFLMNNNDDDDKNAAGDSSQQLHEDGQIDDSVDEAEGSSTTSSSSVYCDQPPWGAAAAASEWKCTTSTRSAVVVHSSHQQPPISAGGRRPLLLPPVRFGSCIGFDDMPPSPSSSSCTLLGDEYDGANVNTTSILCQNVDDETNVVTTESASSSHSYRMEKLMPLSTGTVPKQKRRKMGQKKTKKLGTMMKKTAKCSKLEYERELEQLQQQQEDEEEELHAVRSISNGGSSEPKPKSKRGRKSKDNSLVNEHGLPYTAELLTAMPYTAYSELMNDFRLSAPQKAMIKKIRRRGRNKLAAQKCRERRLHQPHGDWEEGWPIMEEDEEELLVDDNAIEIEQIGSSDDIQRGDGLLNPANLSLYPSTSTTTTASTDFAHFTAVTARTTTPSAAAAAVVGVGVVEDDHRRRQEYSEFVHSAIAKRRAIRVQV
uniref:BZIP domain-containing protein n=1 Tax=Globodera pallida TaxID=36090 RepID=A0A183BZF3_GLOPA